MKRDKKGVGAILGLIILVVCFSGCVSSDNNPDMSSGNSNVFDLSLGNTPVVTDFDDGSYMIGGLIHNTGSVEYTKVKLTIMAYNEADELVAQKNATIARIGPGAYESYDVSFGSEGDRISYADVKINTATSS